MNKISTAIVEVEREIADLRDGRGRSRAGLVNLLRQALDALWEARPTTESLAQGEASSEGVRRGDASNPGTNF